MDQMNFRQSMIEITRSARQIRARITCVSVSRILLLDDTSRTPEAISVLSRGLDRDIEKLSSSIRTLKIHVQLHGGVWDTRELIRLGIELEEILERVQEELCPCRVEMAEVVRFSQIALDLCTDLVSCFLEIEQSRRRNVTGKSSSTEARKWSYPRNSGNSGFDSGCGGFDGGSCCFGSDF